MSIPKIGVNHFCESTYAGSVRPVKKKYSHLKFYFGYISVCYFFIYICARARAFEKIANKY